MGRPPSLHFTVGQRIGRGTVVNPDVRLRPTERQPSGVRGAELLCDCGTTYQAVASSLVERNGRINTTSCGCAQREAAARTGRQTVLQAQTARWAVSGLDGLTAERKADYQRWSNMMARCYNPDYPKYRYWGGRGVQVCTRWHDLRLFLEDIDRLLGPCPVRFTLDRVDPDGNYSCGSCTDCLRYGWPFNVRWASYSTQNWNLRKQEGTTSRYKGVSWDVARGKWQAKIGVAGRTVMLGRFDDEGDAYKAYLAALRSVAPEIRQLDPS